MREAYEEQRTIVGLARLRVILWKGCHKIISSVRTPMEPTFKMKPLEVTQQILPINRLQQALLSYMNTAD